MSFKNLGYLFFLSLPLITVSCDKDEDLTTDYNREDPRIRSVVSTNFKSTTFVINDVESVIYNYDSLAFGSNVSKMNMFFYGYTSTPSIKYKYKDDKEWKNFSNGTAMNFSSPLQILAISEDGTNQKVYDFDLRVHKFDVSAFSWQEKCSLDIDEVVITQKSIVDKNIWYWFCQTADGNNYCFSSETNGQKWTKKNIENTSFNWNTLSMFNGKLYLQDSNKELYVGDIDKLTFSKLDCSKMDYILFELDGKLWAIAEKSLYAMAKDSSDFTKVSELPSEFSLENFVTFTTESAATQLGYIYVTKDDNGSIWSVDYKGGFYQLIPSDGTIPYLVNPMVYNYNNTLSIVGGQLSDGTYSSKCYASYDNGVTWTEDWHKQLIGDLQDLNSAGVFLSSKEGEMVIVGGNKGNVVSPIVWRGVLNQLIADELNYRD